MIYPVILCGGAGTRLWPLSRKSYPKQFAKLIGEESLFQASIRRVSGAGFAAPVIVTNADFRFIVAEQMEKIGVKPAAILIEPSSRNTAPAVLVAALWLEKNAPDALMLVAPSDHVVKDVAAFNTAIDHGRPACADGKLVTFGITPDRPETGYGYLEMEPAKKAEQSNARALRRFVEKPDAPTAQKMLDAGNYLWNGGIFLFSVGDIITAFKNHASGLIDPCQTALADADSDLGFLRLSPAPWDKMEDISIDYAIMEKSSNLAVVPFDPGWSDLGGWDAVWRESSPDADGVATQSQTPTDTYENVSLRYENEILEVT